MLWTMTDFDGAKLAILCGNRIVAILRDNLAHIPWPGHWDLPGGGREGLETPEDCVLRELREELGLTLQISDLHWRTEGRNDTGGTVCFFVSEQPGFDATAVRFGDEGQEWRLAPIDWFLAHEKTIPHHRRRLEIYLAAHRADGKSGQIP